MDVRPEISLTSEQRTLSSRAGWLWHGAAADGWAFQERTTTRERNMLLAPGQASLSSSALSSVSFCLPSSLPGCLCFSNQEEEASVCLWCVRVCTRAYTHPALPVHGSPGG